MNVIINAPLHKFMSAVSLVSSPERVVCVCYISVESREGCVCVCVLMELTSVGPVTGSGAEADINHPVSLFSPPVVLSPKDNYTTPPLAALTGCFGMKLSCCVCVCVCVCVFQWRWHGSSLQLELREAISAPPPL